MDLGCSANFSSKCLINAVTGNLKSNQISIVRLRDLSGVKITSVLPTNRKLARPPTTCILRRVRGTFHSLAVCKWIEKETDAEKCDYGQSDHIGVRNAGVDAAAFARKNRTPSIPMMGCSPSSIFWVKPHTIASIGESDAEERYQDRKFSIGCSGLFILP